MSLPSSEERSNRFSPRRTLAMLVAEDCIMGFGGACDAGAVSVVRRLGGREGGRGAWCAGGVALSLLVRRLSLPLLS